MAYGLKLQGGVNLDIFWSTIAEHDSMDGMGTDGFPLDTLFG